MNKKPAATPLAKAFLEQVPAARRRLETLRQKQDNLRMLTTDTASHLSFAPRSDSPDLQRNETLIAEIDALEEQIILAEREVDRLSAAVGWLIYQIETPLYQRILLLRYLEELPWQEIADDLQYTKRHVFRLAHAAYGEAEPLLKKGGAARSS